MSFLRLWVAWETAWRRGAALWAGVDVIWNPTSAPTEAFVAPLSGFTEDLNTPRLCYDSQNVKFTSFKKKKSCLPLGTVSWSYNIKNLVLQAQTNMISTITFLEEGYIPDHFTTRCHSCALHVHLNKSAKKPHLPFHLAHPLYLHILCDLRWSKHWTSTATISVFWMN